MFSAFINSSNSCLVIGRFFFYPTIAENLFLSHLSIVDQFVLGYIFFHVNAGDQIHLSLNKFGIQYNCISKDARNKNHSIFFARTASPGKTVALPIRIGTLMPLSIIC